MENRILFTVLMTLLFSFSTVVHARDYISIVGSSTVYPFATTVAESFGRSTDFPTPAVESTGTGGGMKLFCSGLGDSTPDITNASRPIKTSEIQLCASNGVTEIIEVLVGYDGITIANSKDGKQFKLTTRDIFLALAEKVPGRRPGQLIENPYVTWDEVNPALPNIPIRVLGPPPTSGTRDAFNELVMEAGCQHFDWIRSLINKSTRMYRETCHTLRSDGAYVDTGENDNLIVRKLATEPETLGIFGYSFLEQNLDTVQPASIDGSLPNFETIATGEYPVSRPLYFYVKRQHLDSTPGIELYMRSFIAERAIGEDGYLLDKGMIPLSPEEIDNTKEIVANLEVINL